ncbi:DUF3175 domain-containing protein [Actibacterium sp. MT2.3-13A]|uniref:DUF3175 domain-containing protein n=1 Tax=Actibacterium sp. MT2.3-13A TaxID=2828332 RepID=UPI001BA78972|nr:DUF3175 domain-containing protein [Actibacterium sp. MT2.3-13A]
MPDKPPKRWSQKVTETSHALALEEGVFTWDDPKRIAASLKRSAEESTQRKGTVLQSSMSMLSFYINRAGRTLDPGQREILEQAKAELRALFRDRRGPAPPLDAARKTAHVRAVVGP